MPRLLAPTFGIDLGDRSGRSPVEVMREVAKLLDRHHLVRVSGAEWSESEQREATEQLGTLIGTVSQGSVVPNVRLERGADRFADRWHADVSWSMTPAASVLLCIEAGEAAEPTQFVETMSAVDALAPSERSDLIGRVVTHDLSESRRRRPAVVPEPTRAGWRQRAGSKLSRSIARRRGHGGLIVPAAGERGSTRHPLIDRCPRTGVEFFRLGDHAWSISGLTDARSDEVLSALQDAVERGPSWSVPWSEGTLVVYDNRMILHRRAGVAGSDPGRVLRRTMAEWRGRSAPWMFSG